jgi:hypothetical protein
MSEYLDEPPDTLLVRRRTSLGWQHLQTLDVMIDGPWVRLDLDTSPYPVGLTPAQARFLAEKLQRLAQLIDAQLGPQEVISILRQESD